MNAALAHGFWLIVEKILRWCVHPRLRARIFGLLGAKIGRNVRINEAQFFNHEKGFRHLALAADVHVGPGCRLDLAAPLVIGARTTVSPGVTILTHADPGSSHGSAIARLYPPRFVGVTIGSDCWIGANATILAGASLGDRVIVGAASVVRDANGSDRLVAGEPATVRKELRF
jgi:acetyltransferase-like isoleucine patch superfamily enzyme